MTTLQRLARNIRDPSQRQRLRRLLHALQTGGLDPHRENLNLNPGGRPSTGATDEKCITYSSAVQKVV